MRASKFLIGLATVALAGIGIFALLVWRAIETADVVPGDASRIFDTARSNAGGGPPLVARQPDGALARKADPPPDAPGPIERISILTYHATSRRLSRTEVPFWFYRLKAPAAQVIFGNTSFDLSDLGLTGADLERAGPGLVFDETDAAGNRWLVWTQGP